MPSLDYWRWEMDGAGPDPVRCPNCDRKYHPASLSPEGLCEVCLQRGKDDARELRAEAGRRP